MISMIEIHEIVEIYRTKRADIVPFLATFLISLWLGLEFGILAGVVINVMMTLYTTSRPTIDYEVEKVRFGVAPLSCQFLNTQKYLLKKQVDGIDILILTPDQSLNYSSAEYFKSTVIKKVTTEYLNIQHILINGVSINKSVDVTAVKVSMIVSNQIRIIK
jgi:MFS superfamily sulfate permease-like transporter